MHFSKTRYVTFCQQLLVTACVLATAVAAAGVVNLDIVAPAPDAALGWSPRSPSVTPTSTPRRSRRRCARWLSTASTAASPQRQRPTRDGLRLAVVSPAEKATGLATVGVTWNEAERLSEDQVQVDVRTRKAGRWSTWSALEYHDDHGPDASEPEGRRERAGTEPSVVGHVQSVQVRAWTATGRAPRGIKLAVIDPGDGPTWSTRRRRSTPATLDQPTTPPPSRRPARGQPTGRPSRPPATSRSPRWPSRPKPEIFSRAQWGANEKLREQSAPELRHHQDRLRAPHGQRQQLHQGRGARAAAQHLRLPRAVARLARHRLQLPRRPLRPDLGGPLGRRRQGRRRRAHARLQRGRLRDVGDRQLRGCPARRRPCSTPTRGCSPGSSRCTTSRPTPPSCG